MRSKPIWAASPSSYRPIPAIARTPTSRLWKRAGSMATSRPAGPRMRTGRPEQGPPPLPTPGRRRRPKPQNTPTPVEAMREKLKAGGHDSPYRLRKQLPEPVFGQIKEARGFRQFLLRGLEEVQAEWSLVCTAHNLLKLAQRRTLSALRSMAPQARPTVA